MDRNRKDEREEGLLRFVHGTGRARIVVKPVGSDYAIIQLDVRDWEGRSPAYVAELIDELVAEIGGGGGRLLTHTCSFAQMIPTVP